MKALHLLLLLAFIALSASFLTYRTSLTSSYSKDSQVFLKSHEKVIRFTLITPHDTFIFLKEKEEWWLEKPVRDKASLQINPFLEFLKKERIEPTVLKEDIFSKKIFQLKLFFENNLEKNFYFSSQRTIDGRYFLKKEEQIFLTSSFWRAFLERKDWRRYELYKKREDLISIELVGLDKKWLFQKDDDGKWGLFSEFVQNLLSRLPRLRASEILPSKKKEGFLPFLQLRYKGNIKPWTLEKGPKEGSFYKVITSDRDFVFKVPDYLLEFLIKGPSYKKEGK